MSPRKARYFVVRLSTTCVELRTGVKRPTIIKEVLRRKARVWTRGEPRGGWYDDDGEYVEALPGGYTHVATRQVAYVHYTFDGGKVIDAVNIKMWRRLAKRYGFPTPLKGQVKELSNWADVCARLGRNP